MNNLNPIHMAIATFLSILFFSTPALCGNKDSNLAKQHFQEGKRLFENEKYEKAADAFRNAYELKPTWRLLFNIGQAETAAKRYGMALDAFEHFLTEGGDDISIAQQQLVMNDIQRLRLMVGIVIVKAPDGAEVIIDDIPRGIAPLKGVLRLKLGEHMVVIKKNDELLHNDIIEVVGGITTTIKAEAPSKPQPTTVPAPEKKPVVNPTVDEKVAPILQKDNDITPDASEELETPEKTEPTSTKGSKLLVSGLALSIVGLTGTGVGIGFNVRAAGFNDDRKKHSEDYTSTGLASSLEEAKEADSSLKTASSIMIAGYVGGGVFMAAGITLMIVDYIKKKKKGESLSPIEVQAGAGNISIQF